MSWGVEENKDIDLAAALDRFIFKDKTKNMGQFVLDIGNYYLQEGKTIHNSTNIHRILRDDPEDMKHMDKLEKSKFEQL